MRFFCSDLVHACNDNIYAMDNVKKGNYEMVFSVLWINCAHFRSNRNFLYFINTWTNIWKHKCSLISSQIYIWKLRINKHLSINVLSYGIVLFYFIYNRDHWQLHYFYVRKITWIVIRKCYRRTSFDRLSLTLKRRSLTIK